MPFRTKLPVRTGVHSLNGLLGWSNPGGIMDFDPDGLEVDYTVEIIEQEQSGQEITIEDWVEAGKSLANTYRVKGLQWTIGDWLNQYPPPPEPSMGNAYEHGERILDIAKTTLYDWASTAKRMPSSVRAENRLSFTHHRAIANALADADEATKKRWVEDAISEEWSVADLNKRMRSVTEPTFNLPKSFNVKIPMYAFETLHSIARGRNSTDQKVASEILVEHLSSDEVKVQAAIELKQAQERTRERRQRAGRRTARAYDPLRLQR
jgi:hypothetical protein